ncbi:MAG: tRNA (adenosine(37)-N6)-dimethylallyltransferase MiaA [Bacilli bacterium]|nr:tRNA (adenosine(37)-N6)-dimethylallyltransferase MiaA [Bacilli bacterium]
MDKVVIITGPTAVGKTKCSLLIAERLKTEIINGDAYQIYKGMDIGTAKPSKDELSKIKHHLIDYLDPLENFSVADYQRIVRDKISEFKSKNIIPLIVGGSGLYLESVICNYTFDGKTRDHSFEEKYKNLSNEELHLLLKDLDNVSYNEIHPNNRKRVLRALEIALNNEQKGTKKKEMLYDALVIVLNDDREVLYNRINKRVDQMLEEGLLEEVKSFYPNKLGLTAKAAIGYKELFDYFDGNSTKEEAIDKIKQYSRNYAKRQLTWFRNKEYVTEVLIDVNNFNNTVDEVYSLIDKFLKE